MDLEYGKAEQVRNLLCFSIKAMLPLTAHIWWPSSATCRVTNTPHQTPVKTFKLNATAWTWVVKLSSCPFLLEAILMLSAFSQHLWKIPKRETVAFFHCYILFLNCKTKRHYLTQHSCQPPLLSNIKKENNTSSINYTSFAFSKLKKKYCLTEQWIRSNDIWVYLYLCIPHKNAPTTYCLQGHIN